MTEARVMPVVGALLGIVLGLVTMGLLTALGVIAPDRLPVFALVGIGLVLGAALLTQRISLAKKRLVTAIVLGAILAGVSLTGIPEVVRGGAITDGCMVTGTSSLESTPVAPADTSAVNGFSVTTTDTVQWTTQTTQAATAATATISLKVAGFGIPVRYVSFSEAPELSTWTGQAAVADELATIQDATGLLATGLHHLEVEVDSGPGECAGNAYLHVVPDGAFDGLLLVLLWVALGVIVAVLVVLTIVVRRSIRESDRTLAMVGMSAIQGETSTTVPTSPPTPAGPPRVSEPSQPTAPESPPAEDDALGDKRIGKGNDNVEGQRDDRTDPPPSG